MATPRKTFGVAPQILSAYANGESAGAIGRKLGVSTTTVTTVLKRHGVQQRPRGNPERDAEIVRRYAAGERVTDIANDLGVCVGQVKLARRKQSAPVRDRTGLLCRLNRDQRAAAVAAYQTGESSTSIADRLGMTHSSIGRFVRAGGLACRGRSHAAQKHTVDELAFDRDTPEARYWVGFLMADGCLSNYRPKDAGFSSLKIALQLACSDVAHVHKFRSFLKASHPVTIRPNNGAGKQDVAGLSVTNKAIGTSLIKLGVVPNKTHTAKLPPHLASDRDAWRGMIDGDGWISLGRQRSATGHQSPTIGITGTRDICDQFAAFVARHVGKVYAVSRNNSIWMVKAGGANAVRIMRLLYDDAAVSLDRKRSRVHEILCK